MDNSTHLSESVKKSVLLKSPQNLNEYFPILIFLILSHLFKAFNTKNGINVYFFLRRFDKPT